jgi:hypothetical protein
VADRVAPDALHHGVIRIGARCVTIERSGQAYVPIWPAASTRWDPVNKSIVFLSRTEGALIIRSGDSVSLGGGLESSTPDWINPPDPTCPKTYWTVNSVTVE